MLLFDMFRSNHDVGAWRSSVHAIYVTLHVSGGRNSNNNHVYLSIKDSGGGKQNTASLRHFALHLTLGVAT